MMPTLDDTTIERPVIDAIESLAIADAIINLEAFRCCALLRLIQQCWSEIDAGDLCMGARRTFRNRSGPAGEIKPLIVRLRIQPFDQQLVDVRQRFRDALVGARAPHRALALLKFFEGHAIRLPTVRPRGQSQFGSLVRRCSSQNVAHRHPVLLRKS